MLKYMDSTKMGRGDYGEVQSLFHFSFADYYNPENIQFGVLRVLNDDIVLPASGFDTHSHKNMEILSYVVEGELTHADSLQNRRTLTRGQVQYMSAGTGVFHSEHNLGKSPLRFLQIWILPDRNDYRPDYGEYRFQWADRENRWMPIASAVDENTSPAPIRIHADVNMYASEMSQGTVLTFRVPQGRQAYLVLVEGRARVGDIRLEPRDALEVIGQDISIDALDRSHLVVIEMSEGIQHTR